MQNEKSCPTHYIDSSIVDACFPKIESVTDLRNVALRIVIEFVFSSNYSIRSRFNFPVSRNYIYIEQKILLLQTFNKKRRKGKGGIKIPLEYKSEEQQDREANLSFREASSR